MRREPLEQSEMLSQLLFGECYKIINEREGFFQIFSDYDQYIGWIDSAMHHEITGECYERQSRESQPVQSALIMCIAQDGFSPLHILAGSTLPGYNQNKDTLEIDGEVYHIRWTFEKFDIEGVNSIHKTAAHFLNTPYLWGGRSFFGSDCSGFIQLLYKIHGIQLSRDAYQQAEAGEPVHSLSDSRPGDLAFFRDENHSIYHVGLIISPSEIIHNSGFVHIDRIDETGIFNLQKQQYTHRLHTIKRVTGY